jgi:hypothetical protein
MYQGDNMNDSQLAASIAQKVVMDTKFWVAIIGLVGALIGAFITILGNILLHWLKNSPQRKLDEQRISVLEKMLEDDRFPEKWRNLSTMAAVIGADESETKRLLIKAGARGSEKADGKWGLIKHHPFPSSR